MCDDNHRARTGILGKTLQEQRLGHIVEGCRRLIHNYHTALTQQTTSDSYTLRLTLAKSHARLRAGGVKTQGQVKDKLRHGSAQRITQLLIGSRRISQEEIATHRTAYERVTLRHISHVATCKRRERHSLLAIINLGTSRLRLDEAKHNPYHSTLSGTRMTKHSRDAPRRKVVREVFEHTLAITVREVNTLHTDTHLVAQVNLATLFEREIYKLYDAVDGRSDVDEGWQLTT